MNTAAELTQLIKREVSLPALASDHTTLKRVGRELHGPCPMCGGEDRFTIHADRVGWLCRGCAPRGGDVVGLAMALYRTDWKGAVARLGYDERDLGRPPRPTRPVAAPAEPAPWEAPDWQKQTLELVEAAEALLPGSDGERYLARRAIDLETARLYRLGWTASARAVVIPWIGGGGRVTALKKRFLEAADPKKRFIQAKGSRQLLFGAHRYRARRAVLVEGEFNCISLAVALPEHDVLSPGGEANVRVWESAFEQLDVALVWVDEPARAAKLRDLPGGSRPRYLCSPRENGAKLDANDVARVHGIGALRAVAIGRLGG